jgi:lysylphosphatidylglycerol synthetase-like protein (DUF2156 family)
MSRASFPVWRCLALLLLALSPALADEEDDVPVPRLAVHLARGPETVRLYEPDDLPPRAIFVFGSGDGGWSAWEDVISHWLREDGIFVVGFNMREYAKQDYDAATLGRDMAALAREAATRGGGTDTPVIYGGWSMGAVQVVAAAAWKDRPVDLAGLMLMSADSRGRYGLRAKDELGVTPTGPGTFALSDFSNAMTKLRVAQFHGGADFMASTAWIRSLKSKHQLYTIPGANHGFDGPSDDFHRYLLHGINWVLGDDSEALPAPRAGLPFGLSPLWPATALAIGLAVFFILSRKHSVTVLAWAVLVMGAVDLLEALFTKPPSVIAWMETWVPLGVTEKSRLLLLFSGLLLLSLSRGLRRHKRIAWLLALALLCVSAVLHLTRAFDWHHAIGALVLIVPLVRWRKDFVARSDAPSIRIAWIMAAVVALALFVYGTLSLHEYSQRGNFGEPLTWRDCAQGAAAAVVAQKTEFDRDGGRDVRNFLRTLRTGSLLGGLVVLGLLLRPVIERRIPDATDTERKEVKDLIARHGQDPMNGFALLPDKRYFFTADGETVVAYALWRKFAVALADPIAAREMMPRAIAEFVTFCKQQDWEPLFYCAHVNNRALYEEAGFITFKVGEDARLDVNEFKLQGGKFQNLRTARNKAQKAGLTFQWYDASPHPDHGLEAQLTLISQQWLDAKHGGEMTFDLGTFSVESLRERGCAIVRNSEGRIETFATWLSYNHDKGRCLDLMRGRNELKDVLDFLIVEAIDHFKALGVEQISLGNAPLANVDAVPDERLELRQERAVKFLFDNFDKFYGYKSLFNFKKKYAPDWQGRYLAYRPRVSLAMVGLAIAGVHLPKGFMGLLKS